MNINKIIPSALLLLASLMSISAEEALNLTEEDAVELGLKQNISLKQTAIDLETSVDQNNSSWNVFLPAFSIEAGISYKDKFLTADSNGITTDPWGMSANGGLSLSVNAGSFLNSDINEVQLKTSQLKYESDEKNLELQIRKGFKFILASKENLTLIEKNMDLAQKRYDQAKINFNIGLISELDLLSAQNSVELLKPSIQDTETSYNQQLMNLKTLLGIDLSAEIDITGDLDVTSYTLDSNILTSSFMAKRSDINSGLLSIELQELLNRQTEGNNKIPSIRLAASWSNTFSQLIEEPDWSDSLTLSATVSIPVNGYIPGSSQSLAIKSGEHTLEKSKLGLQSTLNSAESEIISTIMELDGSWANIETTQRSLVLANKTYEMTEDAFKKGSAELLDVEDAQNKLLSANQDLLMSKYNYLAGLLDLESALNTDMETILEAINVAADK